MNDFSQANERFFTSERTIGHSHRDLLFKHEKAVSITNVVARLSALAQNMVGGLDLSPRTNSYEIEQK